MRMPVGTCQWLAEEVLWRESASSHLHSEQVSFVPSKDKGQHCIHTVCVRHDAFLNGRTTFLNNTRPFFQKCLSSFPHFLLYFMLLFWLCFFSFPLHTHESIFCVVDTSQSLQSIQSVFPGLGSGSTVTLEHKFSLTYWFINTESCTSYMAIIESFSKCPQMTKHDSGSLGQS